MIKTWYLRWHQRDKKFYSFKRRGDTKETLKYNNLQQFHHSLPRNSSLFVYFLVQFTRRTYNSKITLITYNVLQNGNSLIKWQKQKLKHIIRINNNCHLPYLVQTRFVIFKIIYVIKNKSIVIVDWKKQPQHWKMSRSLLEKYTWDIYYTTKWQTYETRTLKNMILSFIVIILHNNSIPREKL